MDFEHLYKTYFIDVFYYMRGICKDEAICEEVAQETFFKALKKRSIVTEAQAATAAKPSSWMPSWAKEPV